MHSQAMTYAKLAESATLKTASLKAGGVNLNDDDGLFTVLPVSAESTGLLPNRRGNNPSKSSTIDTFYHLSL